MSSQGWRPLGKPERGDYRASFVTGPFTRLARAHAVLTAGDTMVAIALAGSLFFDIKPDAARTQVARYLLLTMAPFAVVAPLIGPMIDRVAGGRRLMVVVSAFGRAVLAALMVSHIDGLLLFPLALGHLVLSKGYAVAKSALVPTVVSSDDELVEANGKLGVLAGAVGFAAAVPALLISLLGSAVVVGVAAIVFGAGAVVAWQLPRSTVATSPAGSEEKAELRSATVLLAASAMATLRGIVGFLTMQTAFWFRNTGAPTWWFGVVLGFSTLGAFLGSATGTMRRSMREESMLVTVLVLTTAFGVLAMLTGGRSAAALLAAAVGFSSTAGKLAFDAILQRDAPDANRGRSFAQFETRFQLVWVLCAFVPVVVPFPGWVGFLVVVVAAAFGAVTYLVGQRQVRERGTLPEPLREKARRTIEARRAGKLGNGPFPDLPPPAAPNYGDPLGPPSGPAPAQPPTSLPPSPTFPVERPAPLRPPSLPPPSPADRRPAANGRAEPDPAAPPGGRWQKRLAELGRRIDERRKD